MWQSRTCLLRYDEVHGRRNQPSPGVRRTPLQQRDIKYLPSQCFPVELSMYLRPTRFTLEFGTACMKAGVMHVRPLTRSLTLSLRKAGPYQLGNTEHATCTLQASSPILVSASFHEEPLELLYGNASTISRPSPKDGLERGTLQFLPFRAGIRKQKARPQPRLTAPLSTNYYFSTCSSFLTSKTLGTSLTVMPARFLSPSVLT